MTYEQLKHLKPSAFKRRCGVRCETFEQMIALLRPHLDRTGKRGDRMQAECGRPTAAGTGVRRGNIAPSFISPPVGE